MQSNERKNSYPESSKMFDSNLLAKSDSYIINSLLRCGIGYPTIFSLIWGDTLASSENFPYKLRKIVVDIIQEEKKKNETFDSLEKQLHSIAIDLLWFLYEREVNVECEEVLKISGQRH